MPRQRIPHGRRTHDSPREFPGDFAERLERFKEESGLSWAEIARRLGVDRETVRRWRKKGVHPTGEHLMALLDLADSFGLGHLFTG